MNPSAHSVCRGMINHTLLFLLIMANVFPALAGRTETPCTVAFQVNMTRAVQQNIFNPAADYLYLVMDQGIEPVRLVPGPGYQYSCTLVEGLDSGVTYHYKFRINESVWEEVNRKVKAMPGITAIRVWWNDISLNYTRFLVNMNYSACACRFNPDLDSVCIVGTMNNMQGSTAMQRVDSTLWYSYIYSLDPGEIHSYKYRINADSAGLELMNKPPRMILVPDTLLEVSSDFDNINPGKMPMTFRCNMGYYVRARHFDPAVDFIDIAGNFNNPVDHDVLFDLTGDTVYTIDKYLDTTWFQQGPLSFRFRINGITPELPGKPDRSYAFHDTVTGGPNRYTCYYNDLDPAILRPPWVYNVSIQGELIHYEVLSGIYTYENVNGIPEGSSVYQWYRSNDSLGIDMTPIDTAWRITYTVDTVDIGKWLVFEVTPKAMSGDSALGRPVRVVSLSRIGGVGMDEKTPLISKVFPNPAPDYVIIESRKRIRSAVLYDLPGRVVKTILFPGGMTARLETSDLSPGIYLVMVWSADGERGMAKILKQ